MLSVSVDCDVDIDVVNGFGGKQEISHLNELGFCTHKVKKIDKWIL